MARRARALLLAAAAHGACGAGPAGEPAASIETGPGSRTTAEALQAPLDAWFLQPGARGVSAAVILADGSQWTGCAGLARAGERLRPDHSIAVGSVTKTVTAALVLQLAEEGRLRLDDRASALVRGLEHVPPEVTVRQLLNHTDGLANYTLHPAYAPSLAADPSRRFTPREVLALFLEPPVFAAGERTQYTNSAFVVLGLVAEAAGRRPIAETWRERFWTPLGLREVFLPPDEPARGAVANAWLEGAAATVEAYALASDAAWSTRWAAFGLLASPRDVARWGRALFAGTVLSAASRAEMLEFVPPAPGAVFETGSGLGVRRYQYGGREQWGHSGAVDEGSSILLHEPSSGVTVALAMNQPPASHGSSHFALAGELLRVSRGR